MQRKVEKLFHLIILLDGIIISILRSRKIDGLRKKIKLLWKLTKGNNLPFKN